MTDRYHDKYAHRAMLYIIVLSMCTISPVQDTCIIDRRTRAHLFLCTP